MSTAVAVSSFRNRKTPGVYITEIPAFSTSIVGVATAVPIFIGYTQYAQDPITGALLYNTPVSLSSMTDYMQYFGGAFQQSYVVSQPTPPPTPQGSGQPSATPAASSAGGGAPPLFTFTAPYTNTGGALGVTSFEVRPYGADTGPNQFNLYWSMLLFFANGGGQCFVVSVGDYGDDLTATSTSPPPTIAGTIKAEDLETGIAAAAYAVGATMIVVPE